MYVKSPDFGQTNLNLTTERLSIESDHDGNAYASLHVDLGQGRRRPRQAPPPLPTHPPKSRHSQTQPINIVKDLNRSTQVVRSGKSVTPSDVGTQASDTVEVEVVTATDTVEDTLIGVDDNVGKETVETLTEVVIHNSDDSSQPTITLSVGETGNEGTKGAASEVANDDMDEGEEAEGEDDATDDDNESLAWFSPNEEGANTTYPATPLGKKVVTEGREEGPDEGETWRLAASRRRRRSNSDEAQHARLCALAQKLNHFFEYDHREGSRYIGGEFFYVWLKDRKTEKLYPSADALKRFMKINEVAEKDADSLTSDWRNLGVDCSLEPLMEQSRWGAHRRHLF